MYNKKIKITKTAIFISLALLPFATYAQGEFSGLKEFQMASYVAEPDNMDLQPGQFSKDGKKYYMPFKKDDGTGLLQVYTVKGSGKSKLLSLLKVAKFEDYIFSGQVSLTEDELLMVFTGNTENQWNSNDLFIGQRKGPEANFEKIRLLGEVNEFDQADAYAWISSDGLKLYYTRESDVYYSTRRKREEAFELARPLNICEDGKYDITSCWLTPDELKMFFVSKNVIYLLQRDDPKKKFGSPEVYTEEFKDLDYISGISFNPALKVMALYYSGHFGDKQETEAVVFFKVKKK